MAFIYSDLNSFNPTLKPLLVDVESIYQSLYNILNTKKGERLFEPEFGISLEDYLFDLADDVTALAILQEVVTAVTKYEGRVEVDLSNTTLTPVYEKNRYELQLVFRIVGVEGQSFQLRGSLS